MSHRFSRRSWLVSAGSALAGWMFSGRQQLHAARLNWDVRAGATCNVERRYRADAQVLLLGLPIYHRENVGGGQASWREWQDGSRKLEFAGYSSPERAAGLSRLGFIRELSRPSASGPGESIYFGLMTSSPEESAEEAKRALHSNAKDAMYTAIEGYASPGTVETATAHFTGPSRLPAGQLGELEERARTALNQVRVEAASFEASKAAPPVLHALAEALRPGSPAETRYTYGGRLYRLSLRKAADEKAAVGFRERGLLPARRPVVRVAGTIQRESGGKSIDFRLWVGEGDPHAIPLRIEYQAKAYLRLVFEALA
jgi:hypothetical protein